MVEKSVSLQFINEMEIPTSTAMRCRLKFNIFGKPRSHLGKKFLHPQKEALPYTYGFKNLMNEPLCICHIKQGASSFT